MVQEIELKSELQFDLANIEGEIDRTKKLVETRFSDKIRILTDLIGAQARLVGIYTSELSVRKHLRSNCDNNGILTDTLLNFPYRSLSILLLIRNTFYGSARVICRQFFESLISAKYSEYEPGIIQQWTLRLDNENVSSGKTGPGYIFKRLQDRAKSIDALRQTWKDLCNATHATPYSQQVLRVLETSDEQGASRRFLGNTEYTLDLLLALLAMNFHLLIGHYGRKAYRWWFGYLEDPFGSYHRERELKEDSKRLIRQYFEKSMGRKSARGLWKTNIFEFKQSWG